MRYWVVVGTLSARIVAAVEAEFIAQFTRRFGYDEVQHDVVSIREMLVYVQNQGTH